MVGLRAGISAKYVLRRRKCVYSHSLHSLALLWFVTLVQSDCKRRRNNFLVSVVLMGENIMNKRTLGVVTIILIFVCYGYMGIRMHQWKTYGKKEYFKKQGVEGLCQEYKRDLQKWKKKHALPWMWSHNFEGSINDWFPE